MGPKATYTSERLRAFGAKAVENAKKRFPDCDFACVYTGGAGAVANPNRPVHRVGEKCRAPRLSKLRFRVFAFGGVR